MSIFQKSIVKKLLFFKSHLNYIDIKNIIIIITILFYSCKNNQNNEKEYSPPRIDTISAEKKCVLDLKEFKFKDLILGANIDENKKKLKETDFRMFFYDKDIMKLVGIKTYVLSNYTIFEKQIQNLTVHTYNSKIFEIVIYLEDDISIELTERFNIKNCYEFNPEEYNCSINAENENYEIKYHCVNIFTPCDHKPLTESEKIESSNLKGQELLKLLLDREKKNRCRFASFYITDKNLLKIVHQKEREVRKKLERKKKDDF